MTETVSKHTETRFAEGRETRMTPLGGHSSDVSPLGACLSSTSVRSDRERGKAMSERTTLDEAWAEERTRRDLATLRRSLPVIVGPATAELWNGR